MRLRIGGACQGFVGRHRDSAVYSSDQFGAEHEMIKNMATGVWVGWEAKQTIAETSLKPQKRAVLARGKGCAASRRSAAICWHACYLPAMESLNVSNGSVALYALTQERQRGT